MAVHNRLKSYRHKHEMNQVEFAQYLGVNQSQYNRYEALFDSGIIQNEPWQPSNRPPIFPALLILTDTRYAIQSSKFPIFQARNIDEFVRMINAKQANNGIKIKIN